MDQDIYDRDQKLASATADLETMLSFHNYRLVKQFIAEKNANQSIHTVSKWATSFKTLAPEINFNLDEQTENDREELVELVGKINRGEIPRRDGRDEPHAESTLADFKKAIKQFYGWLRNRRRPPTTEFFTCNVPKNRRHQKTIVEIPDENDLDDQIEATLNPRDEALVALLWDTGARIGELLHLRWRHVAIKLDKIVLNIPHSKERVRPVHVYRQGYTGKDFKAYQRLKDWHHQHPNPGTRRHVFTPIQGSRVGEIMKHRSAYKQIKQAAEKGGLDQDLHIHPHIYRAARASYYGRENVPQQVVEEYMGFCRNSKQLERYMMLGNRVTDDYFENHTESRRTKAQGLAS